VVGEDEWRRAVRITGVVRTGGKDFRDRPISFHVAWDAGHLYLATVSDILPGHRLYKSRRERYTTGVVFDDSFDSGLPFTLSGLPPGFKVQRDVSNVWFNYGTDFNPVPAPGALLLGVIAFGLVGVRTRRWA